MNAKTEQNSQRKTNYNAYFIRIGALLALALSISVIFGWYTKNETLIQVLPTFAPMQFNTALCFLFSSVGLLSLSYSFRIIASISTLLCFIVSAITTSQYLFAMDFGIDELFMDGYIQTKTSHPGRMSPLTGICFILISVAMLQSKKHWALSAGFTATVILISALSLLINPTNFQELFGWGSLTRMAIHTAGTFLVLATSFLCHRLSNTAQKKIDHWHAIPALTATITLALTFTMWLSIHESTEARNKDYFQSLINDTSAALTQRYSLYEQALYGGLGLFYASEYVSGDEWEAYTNALQIDTTLPGINGIGYIDYVQENDLESYLAVVQERYRPDFKNYPDTTYQDKFVIKYIEPIDRNIQAVGLDIGFEKNRRQAAERARDFGVPALTRKIELVQDAKKEAGFLLLIPRYSTNATPETVLEKQKKLIGWVYAPFIGSNFFRGLSLASKEQLSFSVYDGSVLAPENTIFSNKQQNPDDTETEGPLYEKVTTVRVAGSDWSISWSTNDNFSPPGDAHLGRIAAIAGSVFSLLLYFLLSSIIYSRQRTAAEVERQTKELKDFANFMALIGDNMPDMMFVKDSEYRIVQANRTFLKAYPEDMRDKIIGFTTVEKYDKKTADAFLADDKQAFKTGYIETEETVQFPNGETKTLFTKKIRFENADKEQFVLGIARDITAEKESEQAILSANQELKRSNTELERFAYLASHDMQEPLRKIGGFTSMLADNMEGKLDDDGKTYMKFIISGVDRMHELIKGLLEYSRINTDELVTEELDSNALVANAMESLSELIKETKTKVKFKDLPTIYHDKVMFTQLLQNLISNAIKYRSDKTPIITIKAVKKDDHWEFSVKDNGMGMKEEHQERIFEMFQRLHRKEDIPGTGIGLSLCQKIVERYNGQIWVTSKPDKGSTFFFTVPIK